MEKSQRMRLSLGDLAGGIGPKALRRKDFLDTQSWVFSSHRCSTAQRQVEGGTAAPTCHVFCGSFKTFPVESEEYCAGVLRGLGLILA